MKSVTYVGKVDKTFYVFLLDALTQSTTTIKKGSGLLKNLLTRIIFAP